jgi:hypothetical protein
MRRLDRKWCLAGMGAGLLCLWLLQDPNRRKRAASLVSQAVDLAGRYAV